MVLWKKAPHGLTESREYRASGGHAVLQYTIDKAALAQQVQEQLHQFVTAHLGYLSPRLHAQTYRNLVRMEAGPQALWTRDQSPRHGTV